MSHLHVPDGILPLWLVLAGWVLAIAAVAVSVRRASDAEMRRRIPLVGVVGALMLVAMSSELVPIAYHINLSIVAGILLGPWLSVITAFVVVTVLGLIGHGGVTVIGLNTAVIATEMVLGWALFGLFVRWLGQSRPGLSAAVATMLTLFVTTTLVIGIVALGGSPAASRESGAFDPKTLRFENPFAEGVLASTLVGGEEEETAESLDIGRFALMLYGLGSIGWAIESLVTASIVGFVAHVRPSLVIGGALRADHRPIGDEGVHR
jgi:cobalt/nickel transport system permease protein